jgi:hypothetical protein
VNFPLTSESVQLKPYSLGEACFRLQDLTDGRHDRDPEIKKVITCHTQFLRPKPDTHRMYAQDQVVIHTVRM